MILQNETPDWLDSKEYPFLNKYVQLTQGQMHYIDEGEGEVILFIHGTPTWSFLYRKHIEHFSKNYRCIAMDHIGFGLSEKPMEFDGKPESHSENLTEFIRKLDLRDITLVVHDFGGPIGLSAAIREPDRFKRIITYNTWLWETDSSVEIQKLDKMVNSGIGKFMYLRMNASPRILLKQAYYDKKKLTRDIHKQYTGPFNSKESRYSLWNLAKSLKGSSDWYDEQLNQIDSISDKPWMIMWGDRDKFITPGYLEKWKNILPGARVDNFDCGHFVQEEMPERSIIAMESFLTQNR